MACIAGKQDRRVIFVEIENGLSVGTQKSLRNQTFHDAATQLCAGVLQDLSKTLQERRGNKSFLELIQREHMPLLHELMTREDALVQYICHGLLNSSKASPVDVLQTIESVEKQIVHSLNKFQRKILLSANIRINRFVNCFELSFPVF